jgi:hypothetical protein
MSILSGFNNVLINFIEDCILVFPEEDDFKVFKRGLNVLIKFNPKKIVTIFKQYLVLYRTKIIEKNEDFFLENDYEEVQKYNDKEIFDIINKIKKYWITLDNNNKTKIWDYLVLLINISDKIDA